MFTYIMTYIKSDCEYPIRVTVKETNAFNARVKALGAVRLNDYEP